METFDEQSHVPRPNYDKRITDPTKLIVNTAIRRYYLPPTTGWQHTDYIVAGPVYREQGQLHVPLRTLEGRLERLALVNMGVIRQSRGRFNPVTYTIPL